MNQETDYDKVMANIAKINGVGKKTETENITSDERLKRYYTPILGKDEEERIDVVRILTNENGVPFDLIKAHKLNVDGKPQTLVCPLEMDGTPCPICEKYAELSKSKDEIDKKLAKTYKVKDFPVVKLVYREKESEGIKFYRFNKDFNGDGVMDKITSTYKLMYQTEKINIFSDTEGLDLLFNVKKMKSNTGKEYSKVSNITPARTTTPLSSDPVLFETYKNDTTTWRDRYRVYPYDYLSICLADKVPYWDKERSMYKAKDDIMTTNVENVSNEKINELIGRSTTQKVIETSTIDNTHLSNDDDTDDLPF